MENKKVIVLDFTGVTRIMELHERIRLAFDFPEWYGKNWSAFKDLLFTECDADEVRIYGESTLPDEFTSEIILMHDILKRFARECCKDAEIYPDCKPFTYIIID